MSRSIFETLTLLVFLLPLLAYAAASLAPRLLLRRVDVAATTALGLSLALSLVVFAASFSSPANLIFDRNIPWLPAGGAGQLNCGYMLDRLTSVMLVVVTLVSFLVHLFSIRYMQGDQRYNRYYCCLLLFTTSMLGLVLANNLLFLFIFWELVGLSSYLLIGHWFEKKSAGDAAIKAFITTRIGDVGMFIGLMIIYCQAGSIQYADIFAAVQSGELSGNWRTLAGLGLFFGAMGKSAQFPLHVWLPDAMEGPTPVSALIHAATMVAAGVYLTGRMYPVFDPQTLLFIAYTGAITAIFAATIALVQDDIKKVLAYSTVSQLGYMIMGLGVGGYAAGLFHLVTHAFFKAGLFLGAGAVIYAMHHEQSMSRYGGLMRRIPRTAWCYLLCTLALVGFPGFSGFWSKDAILSDTLVFAQNSGHWLIPAAGFITVFLTAFYMFRQFFLTFTGKPRDQQAFEHAKEPPWQMVLPLVILAALALAGGGLSGKWFAHYDAPRSAIEQVTDFAAMGYESAHLTRALNEMHWEEQEAAEQAGVHTEQAHNAHNLTMLLSTCLGLAGILFGALLYWQRANGRSLLDPARLASAFPAAHRLLWNKYYLDEIYSAALVRPVLAVARALTGFDRTVVDGAVNLFGWLGRFVSFLVETADRIALDGWIVNGLAGSTGRLGHKVSLLQSGLVRQYLAALISGLAVVAIVLIWII